ncbi:hypothetical protein VTN96DRAFT_2800 [Rasamsonia emersonii]|uniref:Sld7 C-terminal domain-containing protein n=1 Tax=Rasamsonia emersonii (strain ATCC 16479 / CBS 393.64 / IMI 116815) TaxID=1408163 RepID=A0A0F4Z1Z2_RASE3|nr:hypothetical protein T310_1430 [Rasamsonia emersonii CBS 393.64]KKA24529.1 hypothetical protein T310_1430 [Rasamsonia emersonii CBS 393.64]
MEVWSGNIATGTGSLAVKLLNSSPHRQCVIPKDVKLSLHSLVNPALIPLYARAGPSVEVHSTNIETSQWLKTRLLGSIWLEEDDDLDRCKSMQCPVGLLISVEGSGGGHPSGCIVSDLLIYGVLSTPETLGRPPSPPNSSSPGDMMQDELHLALKRDLRIYAAPLSASFVQKAQSLPSPPSSPENNNSGCEPEFAQFIPDLRSPSPKRKRIATIFEVAAQHHRRVRQRGGEAVSQLMATATSLSQTAPHLPPLTVKKEPEEVGKPALERLGSRRSRSVSLSGNLRVGKTPDAREDPRPSTAKGQIRRTASKRELSHSFLETESQPAAPSPLPAGQEDEESEASPKDAETIISENKALITRTILTCMRLYGYHRKASRSSSTSKNNVTNSHQDVDPLNEDSIVAETLTAPAEHGHGPAISDEDEFKAMYHATYKASTFALRKYLKERRPPSDDISTSVTVPVLSKERVTNVVDGILKLFCEDN